MKFTVLIGLAALVAIHGDLHAQEGSRNVRVIPSVGSFFPVGDIGYGRAAGDDLDSPAFLSLDRGISVGIAVEAPIQSVLSLRGGVKYGFGSALLTGNEVGTTSCGPDCSEIAYERTRLSDASVLLIGTDLAVRPTLPTWTLRPYVMGGLAFRRHIYDASVIPEGKAATQAEANASQWVPHVGIGAEWVFRAVAVQLDAEMFGGGRFEESPPDGPDHGEFFLSFGLVWTP